MLTALTTAAVLGVGAVRVMSGDLTIGMLVAFQSLMASFMAPIGQMVSLGTTLQETQGDLNRVEDVLRYEPDPQVPAKIAGDESIPRMPHELSGTSNFGVTFGYSRLDPPLIEDFDLTLDPAAAWHWWARAAAASRPWPSS